MTNINRTKTSKIDILNKTLTNDGNQTTSYKEYGTMNSINLNELKKISTNNIDILDLKAKMIKRESFQRIFNFPDISIDD